MALFLLLMLAGFVVGITARVSLVPTRRCEMLVEYVAATTARAASITMVFRTRAGTGCFCKPQCLML